MIFKTAFVLLASILLPGCGNVRYLTTKCTLPDGSTASMASRSFTERKSQKSHDPQDILPDTFTFNGVLPSLKIAILPPITHNDTLIVSDDEGWHIGNTNPRTKSHYILGSGVFVRIDYVEPDRLSLTVTGKNPFDDNVKRPEGAISRIKDNRVSIQVGGFLIDSNWTQSEVIKNNKVISFSENEGNFSTPGKPGFEMRLPLRAGPLSNP